MTGGSAEATGTPQLPGEPGAFADVAEVSAVDATRFAHASEAEMARILDFYAVRWDYEPTTFPILWNLEGEVVESFAPDFYLPDLELFLEMTTLKQRLVRKKNRKLRRLRELYPDVRIKLFYARDFRAMMLKYGRLGLAESLSGTPGQFVPDRPAAQPATDLAAVLPLDVVPLVGTVADDGAASPQSAREVLLGQGVGNDLPRGSRRSGSSRRRRRRAIANQARLEQGTEA